MPVLILVLIVVSRHKLLIRIMSVELALSVFLGYTITSKHIDHGNCGCLINTSDIHYGQSQTYFSVNSIGKLWPVWNYFLRVIG